MLFTGILLVKKPKTYLVRFTVIFIVLSIPYWKKLYQLPLRSESDISSSISVLSYNTKLFRKPGVYSEFSSNLIEWVVKDTSDIKCIQEFSTNSRWQELDVKTKIEAGGYYSYTYSASSEVYGEHNPGTAIFSKYPILNSGLVDPKEERINSMIYADIQVRMDTIRVYNIHLTSYRFDEISHNIGIFKKVNQGINKVRKVVGMHMDEIDKLLDHVNKSDYPVIIAGDFNEIALSNNLFKLSGLGSAFEEAGSGFGFTVKKPPFFLRIDHIFFNDHITVDRYMVDYSIDISDHYPQKCWFRIKE